MLASLPRDAPCSQAAERNEVDCCDILLEAGASPLAANHRRECPLFIAALKGHDLAVQSLLRFMSVPNPTEADNSQGRASPELAVAELKATPEDMDDDEDPDCDLPFELRALRNHHPDCLTDVASDEDLLTTSKPSEPSVGNKLNPSAVAWTPNPVASFSASAGAATNAETCTPVSMQEGDLGSAGAAKVASLCANDPGKGVVIMRGLPGSGKSSTVDQLVRACEAVDKTVAVCSADAFFTKQGKYRFNAKKLGEAHAASFANFKAALQDPGVHHVIVDNTNSKCWEFKHYVDAAQDHGAKVRIVEMQCDSEEQARKLGARNRHSVPKKAVLALFRRWESHDEALMIDPLAPMTPMGPTTTILSEDEDVQAVMHRHAAMEKREVSEANTGQRDQQRREALQKPEEQVAQDPAMTPIDPLSEAGTSDGDGEWPPGILSFCNHIRF